MVFLSEVPLNELIQHESIQIVEVGLVLENREGVASDLNEAFASYSIGVVARNDERNLLLRVELFSSEGFVNQKPNGNEEQLFGIVLHWTEVERFVASPFYLQLRDHHREAQIEYLGVLGKGLVEEHTVHRQNVLVIFQRGKSEVDFVTEIGLYYFGVQGIMILFTGLVFLFLLALEAFEPLFHFFKKLLSFVSFGDRTFLLLVVLEMVDHLFRVYLGNFLLFLSLHWLLEYWHWILGLLVGKVLLGSLDFDIDDGVRKGGVDVYVVDWKSEFGAFKRNQNQMGNVEDFLLLVLVFRLVVEKGLVFVALHR